MSEDEERRERQRRAMERYLATPEGQPTAASSLRQAAPGWYPDPTMSNTRRYWDGSRWTDHLAPDDTPPAPVPAPATAAGVTVISRGVEEKDDVAYAWTIALLPLAWIAVDHFAPGLAGASGATLFAWALTGVLARLDAQRLTARGVQAPGWAWALLLAPVYLILRTRRAGSTAFIPIAWFATAAAYLLAAFTINNLWHFDGQAASAFIERRESRRGGDITVSCPDAWVRDGDEVDCTARSGRELLVLTVHIDSNGYYWRVGE